MNNMMYRPFAMEALKPLGMLTVSLFGEDITVVGGPYRARPANMYGVKMAAEINLPCDMDIPTEDFSTPDHDELLGGVMVTLFQHFVYGKPIYVGCMAGRGRTGLFMATLAHLCGENDPVGYVRANYYEHAVETKEQERFVRQFNRSEFREAMMTLLVSFGAINFTRLRKMGWRDRLLFLRVWWRR